MKGVKTTHRAKTQVYRALDEHFMASVQRAGGWFTIFGTKVKMANNVDVYSPWIFAINLTVPPTAQPMG